MEMVMEKAWYPICKEALHIWLLPHEANILIYMSMMIIEIGIIT